jgi:elongation of very long chain fatty acids protein 4
MPTTSYESSLARAPIDRVLEPPTLQARYTCAAIVSGIIAVWGKLSFDETSTRTATIHSWLVPVGLILFYMISLPLLRLFTQRYLENVSVKLLLRESMVIYNGAQVLLNGWIVYRILHAILVRGHPFIGGDFNLVDTGAAYAVWIHYCDKYLEFLDTYFMVLRGRMDQVCKDDDDDDHIFPPPSTCSAKC